MKTKRYRWPGLLALLAAAVILCSMFRLALSAPTSAPVEYRPATITDGVTTCYPTMTPSGQFVMTTSGVLFKCNSGTSKFDILTLPTCAADPPTGACTANQACVAGTQRSIWNCYLGAWHLVGQLDQHNTVNDAATTQYGLKHSMSVDHAGDRSAGYQYGAQIVEDFNSTTASTKSGHMRPLNVVGKASGTAASRTVGSIYTMEADLALQSTGSGTGITTAVNYFSDMDLTGQNITIGDAAGLWVDSHSAVGTSTTVGNLYGVYIADQQYSATGITAGDAIRVASQTTTNGSEGNVTIGGGAYNTGHLVLGPNHIWSNGGTLMMKPGSSYPTSEGDGKKIMAYNALVVQYGPPAWAAPTFTCTTACSALGAACSAAILMDGANTVVACGISTGHRICECY